MAYHAIEPRDIQGGSLDLVLGVAGVMLIGGLIATAWPARRGMRIQPMEALRAEE